MKRCLLVCRVLFAVAVVAGIVAHRALVRLPRRSWCVRCGRQTSAERAVCRVCAP